jgi:hypothetical protein
VFRAELPRLAAPQPTAKLNATQARISVAVRWRLEENFRTVRRKPGDSSFKTKGIDLDFEFWQGPRTRTCVIVGAFVQIDCTDPQSVEVDNRGSCPNGNRKYMRVQGDIHLSFAKMQEREGARREKRPRGIGADTATTDSLWITWPPGIRIRRPHRRRLVQWTVRNLVPRWLAPKPARSFAPKLPAGCFANYRILPVERREYLAGCPWS